VHGTCLRCLVGDAMEEDAMEEDAGEGVLIVLASCISSFRRWFTMAVPDENEREKIMFEALLHQDVSR
jgi:hypothetical protein